MKLLSLIIFTLFHTLCLGQTQHSDDEKNIKTILQKQEAAWNQGDIELFMSYYAKSDSISFTGKSGVNYGWQNILDSYKKNYPDKSAMGRLAFDIIDFRMLGQKHAAVIGQFTLYREKDKPTGYFSLIFEKQEGHWRIIADHTSG